MILNNYKDKNTNDTTAIPTTTNDSDDNLQCMIIMILAVINHLAVKIITHDECISVMQRKQS